MQAINTLFFDRLVINSCMNLFLCDGIASVMLGAGVRRMCNNSPDICQYSIVSGQARVRSRISEC